MTGAKDRFDAARDDHDHAGLTLHEERIVASDEHEVREVGQVRVRKRIVVEELTVTVPVRYEVADVVRVEADGTETVIDEGGLGHEPRIEDHLAPERAEAARQSQQAGVDSLEDGLSVVCYEERPVVTKQVYAVERVRLGLERQEHVETQTHEVRREEAEYVEEPASRN